MYKLKLDIGTHVSKNRRLLLETKGSATKQKLEKEYSNNKGHSWVQAWEVKAENK